jgi:hypothetical protein
VPDVYATIAEVEPAVVESLVEILELRAADPQLRAMREAYFAHVDFPPDAKVVEVGCGPGPVAWGGWRGLGSRRSLPDLHREGARARARRAEAHLRRGRRPRAAARGWLVRRRRLPCDPLPRPRSSRWRSPLASFARAGCSSSSTATTRPSPSHAATSTRSRPAPRPPSTTWCTIAGSYAGFRSSSGRPASKSSVSEATATSKLRPRRATWSRSSTAVPTRSSRPGRSPLTPPRRSRPRRGDGQRLASSTGTSRTRA